MTREPETASIRVLHQGGCSYAAEGELDMATVATLEARFAHVSGPIALDLRALTFIDSCGVATLLRLQRHCHTNGCEFWIDGCSRQVERVLRIVGLYADLSHRANAPDQAVSPSMDTPGRT